MTNNIAEDVAAAIRKLYASDDHAKRIFDWMSSLKNDAESTSIGRIEDVLKISRKSTIELIKKLEETDCGRFVVGRRGKSSRFEWYYSRVSLGQVAIGETEQVEPVDLEDDIPPLTITKAKRLLAAYFEVRPEQIEIQIKT